MVQLLVFADRHQSVENQQLPPLYAVKTREPLQPLNDLVPTLSD
jgi:hypothetical protein